MAVFKPNLTSDLIKIEAQKILSKKKIKLKILEIGCGDGNISKFLIEKQKKIKHDFFLSDISLSAVNAAKKNINNKNIIIKKGNLYKPWKNQKFDIIISDVSSISEDVSKKSDWYNSILNKSGKDGLKNILDIMKKTHIYLNKNGIFIFPIISLSNIKKLEKTCPKIFSNFKKTKKVFWPLPFFFKKNIKKFQELMENKYIYFENKYGMYIAFTQVGICKI
jgi:16S rRNA (guanine1207-N2)-methyltransferase